MKKRIIVIGIVILLLVISIVQIIKINSRESILKKIGEAGIKLRNIDNFSYEYKSNDETFGNYKKMLNGDKVVQNINESLWYGDYKEDNYYLVNLNEKTYKEVESVLQKDERKALVNPPTIFSLAISEYNRENKDNINWKKDIKEIKKESYNNEECYKITFENKDVKEIDYFNAETFLPVRAIFYNYNGNGKDIEVDYTITLESVNDEDVTINLDELTRSEE